MNIRSFLLIPALVCATTAFAAESNYTTMKIIQTEPARFPNDVTNVGVTTGEAHVSIQIDETGKLTDVLVTGYTHPRFAENAVKALHAWRYEPAVIDGKPHSATADLTFNYETKGMVVVDLTASSYLALRDIQLRSGAYSYSVSRLSQLDRIPTPAKVVQPNYPLDEQNKRRAAQVTVYFYIDEQGHVRMPAVDAHLSEESQPFAAAAIEAVSQWQFEPPMSHGSPVLVAARQDFTFRPDAPVASK